MKMVYKFPYSIKQKRFTLSLSKSWKFVAATISDERPCFWAEVVDGEQKSDFNFEVFGTGQEIPLSAIHLTTYEIGPFVFHLYWLQP